MKEEELQNSVLLVFANKQDLPNALSVSDLTDKLELHKFKARPVSVIVLQSFKIAQPCYFFVVVYYTFLLLCIIYPYKMLPKKFTGFVF